MPVAQAHMHVLTSGVQALGMDRVDQPLADQQAVHESMHMDGIMGVNLIPCLEG